MNRTLKAIAALMLVMGFAVGCNKPDEPNNGGSNGGNDSIIDNTGTLNGHDYVDLGLPSGTQWATCNVGANIPEDHGGYFAWGETQRKEYYSSNTYIFYSGSSLTKYTGSDGLVVLEPTDDAATANWGVGWCTPTHEQWVELFLNTTQRWVEQNGVNGRLFTASNSHNLFLPAAGYCCESGLHNAGNVSNYWSSSLYTDSSYEAWRFFFSESNYDMGCRQRIYGFSVRPVCMAN